jgi:hypothetical protein
LFGTGFITFFGQALLQEVGLEGDNITLALVSVNTGVPIGMAISFYLVRRFDRKPIPRLGAVVSLPRLIVWP